MRQGASLADELLMDVEPQPLLPAGPGQDTANTAGHLSTGQVAEEPRDQGACAGGPATHLAPDTPLPPTLTATQGRHALDPPAAAAAACTQQPGQPVSSFSSPAVPGTVAPAPQPQQLLPSGHDALPAAEAASLSDAPEPGPSSTGLRGELGTGGAAGGAGVSSEPGLGGEAGEAGHGSLAASLAAAALLPPPNTMPRKRKAAAQQEQARVLGTSQRNIAQRREGAMQHRSPSLGPAAAQLRALMGNKRRAIAHDVPGGASALKWLTLLAVLGQLHHVLLLLASASTHVNSGNPAQLCIT